MKGVDSKTGKTKWKQTKRELHWIKPNSRSYTWNYLVPCAPVVFFLWNFFFCVFVRGCVILRLPFDSLTLFFFMLVVFKILFVVNCKSYQSEVVNLRTRCLFNISFLTIGKNSPPVHGFGYLLFKLKYQSFLTLIYLLLVYLVLEI